MDIIGIMLLQVAHHVIGVEDFWLLKIQEVDQQVFMVHGRIIIQQLIQNLELVY